VLTARDVRPPVHEGGLPADRHALEAAVGDAPFARVSARVFEFCSGLVDLVVGVRHHRGGGHRFALAGERFVALADAVGNAAFREMIWATSS